MIRNATLPIELDRDEARDLARRELSQPGYETDLSWPARVLEWVLEQFNRLISGAAGVIPGGLGTVILLAVLVVILIVVVVRTGPMARRRRRPAAVFAESPRSANDYRLAADAAAAAEDWDTAVVERFRAIVAGLQERGVVDVRSGRTADEVAHLASGRLPAVADPLTTGARLFDQVLYGGRPATRTDDGTLRDLDAAIRSARPKAAADQVATPAVPR